MLILTISIRIIFLFCLSVPLVCNGQSTKPRVYIDPLGQRYTRQQFDSISIANIGKLLLQKDRVEKENQIEITFEILSTDPFENFNKKWIGQHLPDFTLKDVNGRTYTNHSLHGKVTVLNFWSVTCGPCLLEMPQLSKLVSKYADRDIIFLAPAPEELPNVQKILSKRHFTYTVLPKAQNLFSAMGIESYPYHLIIDRRGVIRSIYHGSQVNSKTNQVILDERIIEGINVVLKD